MNKDCPFCADKLKQDEIILKNEHCLFLQRTEPVLVGSGLIIPKIHRETVFDLTADELSATFELLHQAKLLIDKQHSPAGYNLGWNSGHIAGQEVFHAHLHVIPRFKDEPLAGKGIRYWLKQEDNKRHNNSLHVSARSGTPRTT
jgi:diadenosine tetraphosphate (Ap4A) HIT family hydrolase